MLVNNSVRMCHAQELRELGVNEMELYPPAEICGRVFENTDVQHIWALWKHKWI